MPPSSDLPGGRRPPSSFCSVDWLSQSSRPGPTHTSRPAEVSWGSPTAPTWGPSRGELSQKVTIGGARPLDLPTRGMPMAGLSKEPDASRAPRARTAFTTVQISTLESAFQLHQYLGPQERKKLARQMELTEVQIKTWFQNRRMKQKRQMQDSQLSTPVSEPLYAPLAVYPPSPVWGSGLQLLCPGGPLPVPQALVLPSGSWGPRPVEQAPLASAWGICSRQPLSCYFPEPGGQAAASSGGLWGLCALRATREAFCGAWQPGKPKWEQVHTAVHTQEVYAKPTIALERY